VKLGGVSSMSGLAGVYGQQQKKGFELAVEEINAGGGAGGAKIELDLRDDASDKAQSAQQTQTLIQQEKVVAILGPTLSNSAPAAHPIAASAKVPMMSTSVSGTGVVGADCSYCGDGWIFRDSLGEATAIPASLKAFAEKGGAGKKVAIVTPNDDKFSVDATAIFKKAAPDHELEVIETVEFRKDDPDVTPFVTKAVNAKPDVLFIPSLGGIPAKVIHAARKAGFEGDILGGNGFNIPAVSKEGGADAKGAQSGTAYFVGNDFAENQEFVKAYETKYDEKPDQFAAQAYTGVLILADAIKRAGLTGDLASDREKVRDALKKTSLKTPLGDFAFTEENDVKQTVWIQQMDGKGGFELVGQVEPGDL
jgi:branched-chain amino acid transport system substrate-binding protein